MKKIHGGDLQSYYEEFGENAPKPLDFSSNISPFGTPSGILEGLSTHLSSLATYPDPFSRRLRQALGETYHLPSSHILCGNGAADLIYRLVFALNPKKALLLAPTFAEYEESLSCISCEISYHMLQQEQNFTLTSAILDDITDDIDLFILCQPNNPTGQVVSQDLLLAILDRCTKTNTFFMIDECFCDFLLDEPLYTLTSSILQHPNLLILRAFTKMYALAGLRLGYCLSSHTTLLEKMVTFSQPWAVSTLGEEGGLLALAEQEYVTTVKQWLSSEGPWLQEALASLGFWVCPSCGNFILFQCAIPHLHQILASEGILLRDCANYHGLSTGFYRVAVRTHEENLQLIDTLKRVCKKSLDNNRNP